MEYCSNCRNLYNIQQNGNNNMLVCEVCNNKVNIPDGMLIFTKKNKIESSKIKDPKIYLYDNIEQKINSHVLLKTTNYNCPNSKCKTHTDNKLKSASIERVHYDSYEVYYICNICGCRWM